VSDRCYVMRPMGWQDGGHLHTVRCTLTRYHVVDGKLTTFVHSWARECGLCGEPMPADA
jgi:hypothetical protein